MATLGQEMRNLKSELQEHWVNAVEGNPRTADPNQKEDRLQHDFATTAAQTDIPQVGTARRCETKNWNESRKRKLPRKRSRLLRTTIKNEDQTMDQNSGLKAKNSNGGTRITRTMDSGEFLSLPIKVSLPGQTSHMGITNRMMEDHMINAQISHWIEAMEIDLEMDLSSLRTETGERVETFLVVHRLKAEIFYKTLHTANQEVINLTILTSANLTIDLRVFSRLTNKYSHRIKTRRHLMWSASPQPMIPLTNYQTSVR